MPDMNPAVALLLPSSCTVRRAEAGDRHRITDLALQLGYPSTAEQIRTRLAEMQNSVDYEVYVAQLPGGMVAGWIGVCILHIIAVDTHAEITGLVIDERARSHGIGKALLDAAEDWARNRGCHAIAVHSNVTRERAHRFYTKNAYRRSKTQHVFCKEL